MSFIDKLSFLLQYPQSVMTGLTYGQNETLVDAEGNKIGEFNPIAEGFKGNLSPSKLLDLQRGSGGEKSFGEKALGTSLNVLFDPTLAVGGVASKALKGTKLAGAAKGADTFGKVAKGVAPDDAGRLAKLLIERGPQLGQLGRRTYQGTLATGDPLTGLGAGILGGQVENQVARLAPKLLARLSRNVNVDGLDVADAVGDGISKELGEPVMARLAREAQDSEVIGAAQDAAFRKAVQLDSINSGLVPTSPVFPGRVPDQEALRTLAANLQRNTVAPIIGSPSRVPNEEALRTLFANLQAGRANPVRALPPGNQNVRSLFPEAVGTNNPFPFIKPRERELGRASLQPAELISLLQDPNQRTAIMRRLTSG